MRFNIHVESLGFQLRIWRVVHARNSFRGSQMVQIRRKLMEFCPRGLLLQFGLLESCLSCEIFKLLTHLLILALHMMQIAFPGVEIVLVLPTVVAAIILLNNFGLLIEEFALLGLMLVLLLSVELATANVSPPDSLHL